MKRAVTHRLLQHLKDQKVISDHYYGWFAYFTYRWAEALQGTSEVLDRVWHKALLLNLDSADKCLVFSGDLSIRVIIASSYSDTKTINIGVPQGMVPPTPLNLHVSDLLSIDNIHCYVDIITGEARYTSRISLGACWKKEGHS